jgi:acyl-CoA synthetase (AMP-forming)/AMP-acid ligase II
MSIMRRLVSMVAKRKVKHIAHLLNHPFETTESLLASVLQQNKDTVLGRKFGFEDIRSPEEYSERVPLCDFESMKPYLDATYNDPTGQIMTKEPVIWYLQTSGSSGSPKRVPITKTGMKTAAAGGAAMWLSYMNAVPENAKILDGTMLLFGAPAFIDDINGIPVGYGTGVYARHQNKIFSRLIAPKEDILAMMDVEEKMRAYATLSAQVDVTALQGIATLSLSFVRRMESEYGPWLLDQLKGTKYEDRVKQAMYDECKIDVAKLWPNLRLFVVGGIDTDPYREWITKTLPQVTIWEAYASSEGFYASQILPEPGVQILPDLNYLEFIPEHEVDSPNPTVLPLADLKKGFRYEVVVTNSNGWYRYRLGDIVTISKTDPYTLRKISRKGKVTNLAGEKVSESHIIQAVSEASRQTSAEVMDYSVVANVEHGVPHYTIAAMFRNNVNSVDFVQAFEDALGQANWEFANSRGMGGLGPTTLEKLRVSAHEKLVRETHLQAKPVPLTTDMSVLDLTEETA